MGSGRAGNLPEPALFLCLELTESERKARDIHWHQRHPTLSRAAVVLTVIPVLPG